MNPLIRRLIFFSIVLMVSGGIVSMVIDATNRPPNLAVAFIFVMLMGFTLLPTSGAVEWYLPSGRLRGYGKTRSAIAVAILAAALGYWAYAIFSSIMSSAGSFSLIGVGATLTSLGWLAYFYVDVTRKNKELR